MGGLHASDLVVLMGVSQTTLYKLICFIRIWFIMVEWTILLLLKIWLQFFDFLRNTNYFYLKWSLLDTFNLIKRLI